MYRYVLAFLFVSTYSGSLGIPLPESAHNGSISALLSSLASSCPNTFLKEQIEAQSKACEVPISPYGKLQYACIMFFDINKQLCESNLTFQDNSSTKINEYIDVENLCTQAKNWSVTDFKDLPGYKDKLEVVLKNDKSCVKICEVEDPISDDANFFCKYFKWGSKMLNATWATISVNKEMSLPNPNSITGPSGFTASSSVSQVAGGLHQDVNIPSGGDNNIHASESPKVSEKLHVDVASSEVQPSPKGNINQDADSLMDVEILKSNKVPINPYQVSGKPGQITNVHDPESEVPGQIPKNLAPEMEKPGQMSKNQAHELKIPGQISKDQDPISIDQAQELQNPGQTPKASQIPQLGQLSDNPLKIPSLAPISGDETSGVQKPPQMQEDGTNEDGAGKPPQKDTDTEDYQDSEENQAAADITDEQNEPDTDPQSEPHPITGTIYKGSASAEEREFYQNTMEDDDHFFPFFLTAVIMVVLLYVLYHNKSKVSKVVLGLIVEGRQPGRRRNSRGHAYKRLDTLEQAMSTSSTAPPSKIIY